MKIIIKNLQKIVPINQRKIRKTALKVLSLEGPEETGEITILFIGDKQMRKLNLMYSGRDSSTDVLSFDNSLKRSRELLADIAISCDTAATNARRFGSSVKDEVLRYVIHGLLHLLGYDDNNKINRLAMQKRQEHLLGIINHEL